MTIKEFVDEIATVYQHNRPLFLEGPQNPYSPQKNAVYELRRAASVLLNDASEKKRQEVEGAIYLCESFGVLNSKEVEHFVRELYKAK